MFDFIVNKTVSEPNVTFVSEDPFLQYVRSLSRRKITISDLINLLNF